jgi:type II secretory pathway pseudopilin PulG
MLHVERTRFGHRQARQAYTLLEVLLAASIALLLLGGLYVAMSVQLRSAQEARDAVEQGSLVRALVARIANDMSGNLAAAPLPASGSSASTSTTTSTAGTTGGTTGGTSGSTTPMTSTPTNSGTAVTFNLGVVGDAAQVTLFVSRPIRPGGISADTGLDTEIQPGRCDLRRITYWLSQGGATTGLARQEVHQITAEDAMSVLPPAVPNEESFVIAPEVKSLTFQYFDGVEWRQDWDGSAPGADGTTPAGPPAAIAFDMSIAVPGSTTERRVRHVVALQCSNGIAQSTTSSSTTSTSGGSR